MRVAAAAVSASARQCRPSRRAAAARFVSRLTARALASGCADLRNGGGAPLAMSFSPSEMVWAVEEDGEEDGGEEETEAAGEREAAAEGSAGGCNGKMARAVRHAWL